MSVKGLFDRSQTLVMVRAPSKLVFWLCNTAFAQTRDNQTVNAAVDAISLKDVVQSYFSC